MRNYWLMGRKFDNIYVSCVFLITMPARSKAYTSDAVVSLSELQGPTINWACEFTVPKRQSRRLSFSHGRWQGLNKHLMTWNDICTNFREYILNSAWRLHLSSFVNIACVTSRFNTNATELQTGYLSANCWAVYRQLLHPEQILGNGGTFSVRPWSKVDRCQEIGARLCAGGLGTALQIGMAWVWFPVVSAGPFIYLIFPDALWLLGRLSFWKKWVRGVSSTGKGGRCVWLSTLLPSRHNHLEILGASNSWRPKGQYRECHEMKDTYPFNNISNESRDKHSQLRLNRRLIVKSRRRKMLILCWTLSCVNWQLLLLKCFSRESLW